MKIFWLDTYSYYLWYSRNYPLAGWQLGDKNKVILVVQSPYAHNLPFTYYPCDNQGNVTRELGLPNIPAEFLSEYAE